MAQEGASASKAVRIENLTPPEGIKYVYANNFAIGQTVYDLRLIFGELTDINEERVQILQRVHLTIGWLEAKALAESLAAYIKNYEESYGVIKTEFTPMTLPKLPQIPYIIQPADKK